MVADGGVVINAGHALVLATTIRTFVVVNWHLLFPLPCSPSCYSCQFGAASALILANVCRGPLWGSQATDPIGSRWPQDYIAPKTQQILEGWVGRYLFLLML